MKAMHIALRLFADQIVGKKVLICTDNLKTCWYIKKMGGTRSPQLCSLVFKMFKWCIANKVELTSIFIPGSLNTLADALSRDQTVKIIHHSSSQHEWCLDHRIADVLFTRWGLPLVDLFATRVNKQCLVFYSWERDKQALAWDSLQISWTGMYAFRPRPLLTEVLKKIRRDQCEVILIAPAWYSMVLDLLINLPILLNPSPALLEQNGVYHPHPDLLQLTAWRLSGKHIRNKEFLQQLPVQCSPLSDDHPMRHIKESGQDSLAGVLRGRLIRFSHL
jgi:hypothetical protein